MNMEMQFIVVAVVDRDGGGRVDEVPRGFAGTVKYHSGYTGTYIRRISGSSGSVIAQWKTWKKMNIHTAELGSLALI